MQRLRSVPNVFVLFLTLCGCNESFEDSDIRGFLEITESGEKSGFVSHVEGGNLAIEVKDPKAKNFFQIRAGKKILKLTEQSSYTELQIMDSRRAPLATIHIPNEVIRRKKDEFQATPLEVDQLFGLSSKRTLTLLRREYVKKGGQHCDLCSSSKKKKRKDADATKANQIPSYRVSGCNGVVGKAWMISDERYDYEFKFTDDYGAGRDSVVATFKSTGERRDPRIEVVDLDDCTPALEMYKDENGMF